MDELSPSRRRRLWLRLGLRLGLALLLLPALRWLGPPLLSLAAPFLLALPAARFLSPLVGRLCRRLGLPRPLLSLLVPALVLAGLGAGLWLLGAAAVREAGELAGDPAGLLAALEGLSARLGDLRTRSLAPLPPSVRALAQRLTDRLFAWLETALPRLLTAAADRAGDLARALPSFALAAAVFFMAACLLTADWPRLRARWAERVPPSLRVPLAAVREAASAGLGGYLRSQLLLSAGAFLLLLGGLLLIRQPYALLLALPLAVLDFVPVLGAGTVLVPWALAELLLGSGGRAAALAGLWGVVTLFRSAAEPKLLGARTGLSPLTSLAAVYLGMRLAGPVGVVLGPVLCLSLRALARSGVLDPLLADLRLAGRDLTALLRDGP